MRRLRRRLAMRAWGSALALLVAAMACGKSDTPAAGTTSSDAARSPNGAAGAVGAADGTDPRRPACAKTGRWVDCQVRERLVRSGLAPRDTTREALPALGPTPVVYRLGRGGLAVYLFEDTLTRARAATRLDTVKYARGSRGPTMFTEAMVIENDNLLALLFSKNEQQIERVSDAFMAGPPQP